VLLRYEGALVTKQQKPDHKTCFLHNRKAVGCHAIHQIFFGLFLFSPHSRLLNEAKFEAHGAVNLCSVVFTVVVG
jgi:hypothetical protein